MLDQDICPEMPECAALYLLDYLFEFGPAVNGGHLTHAEIRSWQLNTGVELSFWEAKELYKLSRVYLGQLYKSAEPDCPAPYISGSAIEQQRELVENKFRQFFSNSKVLRE